MKKYREILGKLDGIDGSYIKSLDRYEADSIKIIKLPPDPRIRHDTSIRCINDARASYYGNGGKTRIVDVRDYEK